MKTSSKQIIINHEAVEIYNIVLDIEKYPNFIPWCNEIIVKSKTDKKIIADMIVKYKIFLPYTFTSHVFFNKKKLSIRTKYIQGPLKNLKTEWLFKEINKNKSLVVFNINFEFEKNLHQKMAELFFELIENKMIDSFVKRADDILN